MKGYIFLDGRPRNIMMEKELSILRSIESVEIKILFFIDGTLGSFFLIFMILFSL